MCMYRGMLVATRLGYDQTRRARRALKKYPLVILKHNAFFLNFSTAEANMQKLFEQSNCSYL